MAGVGRQRLRPARRQISSTAASSRAAAAVAVLSPTRFPAGAGATAVLPTPASPAAIVSATSAVASSSTLCPWLHRKRQRHRYRLRLNLRPRSPLASVVNLNTRDTRKCQGGHVVRPRATWDASRNSLIDMVSSKRWIIQPWC